MKLLNVGCGNRLISNADNIDIFVHPSVDKDSVIVAPAWDLPYDDASVDMIYTCHMLEHVRQDQAIDTIKEFYRVLKPGGRAFIEVPNAAWGAVVYLLALEHGDPHALNQACHVLWGHVDMQGIKRHPHGPHMFGWSPALLEALGEREGFEHVVTTMRSSMDVKNTLTDKFASERGHWEVDLSGRCFCSTFRKPENA